MTNLGIHIKVYESPHVMLDDLGEWLESAASVNNMLLGYLYQLVKKEAAGAPWAAYLVAVFQGQQPKCTLMQLPNRAEAMMVAADEDWEAAVQAASQHMRGRDQALVGMIGPEPQNTAFATAYGQPWHLVFQQNILQLEQLVPPRPAPGQMRVAQPQDTETLVAWMVAFFKESLNKVLLPEAAQAVVAGKTAAGTLYIWEDGELGSMAGLERATRDGVTVVLVYTPPQARGRGYASNLVADLSAQALAQGRKRLCLHTDAHFPTSNKIYMDLGYYPVGYGSILHFD